MWKEIGKKYRKEEGNDVRRRERRKRKMKEKMKEKRTVGLYITL